MASYLVSYERARAEALGLDCKVGLMSRPERIVVLTTGFVFARWYVLSVAVYLLAVLTTFTVLQRILHVRRQLRRDERRPPRLSAPAGPRPSGGLPRARPEAGCRVVYCAPLCASPERAFPARGDAGHGGRCGRQQRR